MLRILGLLVLLFVGYLLLHDSGSVTADLLPTGIDQLLANPRAYDGKQVTVDGVVTGGVGIMGLGGFHLRDLNGRKEIFVVSATGVPPTGTSVHIRGIFREAATVGTYQLPVILLKP